MRENLREGGVRVGERQERGVCVWVSGPNVLKYARPIDWDKTSITAVCLNL